VIIGGGDTGADCLGHRDPQGARSITQLEIMPGRRGAPRQPPLATWPLVYRTSSAHEEGGERLFSVNTRALRGRGRAGDRPLDLVDVEMADGRFQPVEGTERTLPAQLVLLAMGFTGPQRQGLLEQLGVELDGRGNVARDGGWATNVDGVFVCGDMGRGQSLIVWAIARAGPAPRRSTRPCPARRCSPRRSPPPLGSGGPGSPACAPRSLASRAIGRHSE
jgi:glutamate synthase (NADPH/NADH) small chain